MKISGKAVVFMGILFLLSGLLGCARENSQTEDNIVLVDTVHYSTMRDPVYSFALKKKDDSWFFTARCLVGEEKEHYTSFGLFPIPTEEAEAFLTILCDEGEIKRLKKYHDPLSTLSSLIVDDAPSRSTGITFTDASRIEKETALGEKTLDYLYTLADRYYEEAESKAVRSMSIASSSMAFSDSYRFSLDKEDDTWFLSFDAVVDENGARTEREELEIDAYSAEKILAIAKEQKLIDAVMTYKEPEEEEKVFALDETTYVTSFTFENGSRVSAPIDPGAELTKAFYLLAEEYQ